MTSRHDKAVIERLLRIKGATIQGGKPAPKVKPKKPRQSTGMAGLKIGRNVLMRDNENINPKKD